MRLYIALPTDLARAFIDNGFVGVTRTMYPGDATAEEMRTGAVEPLGDFEYVEMRDMPPQGLTFSRTTEATHELVDERTVKTTISGGLTLADYMGDFILSIEAPEDVVMEYLLTEDPPMGMPFREFWLPPEVVNRYLDSLQAFESETMEEVRLDLVGK